MSLGSELLNGVTAAPYGLWAVGVQIWGLRHGDAGQAAEVLLVYKNVTSYRVAQNKPKRKGGVGRDGNAVLGRDASHFIPLDLKGEPT